MSRRGSLKLEDFSDRELLWALQDHAEADGAITADDLSKEIGVSGLQNAMRSVAMRLGYLRKQGIVAKEEGKTVDGVKQPTRWSLTDVGGRLINAVLSDDENELLENLSEDRLLVVTQRLGNVFVGSGNQAYTMATRDLRNAAATRKRKYAA